MTRDEVITRIAREKRVERMVAAIGKVSAQQECEVSQIAYEVLCEKPAEWVVRSESEGWLSFWLLNLVKRLSTERRGRYGSLYRSYAAKARPIGEEEMEITDDGER